jgi:hypothetical protein
MDDDDERCSQAVPIAIYRLRKRYSPRSLFRRRRSPGSHPRTLTLTNFLAQMRYHHFRESAFQSAILPELRSRTHSRRRRRTRPGRRLLTVTMAVKAAPTTQCRHWSLKNVPRHGEALGCTVAQTIMQWLHWAGACVWRDGDLSGTDLYLNRV